MSHNQKQSFAISGSFVTQPLKSFRVLISFIEQMTLNLIVKIQVEDLQSCMDG